MATSTAAVVRQLRLLAKEYKRSHDKLIFLSSRFRAGMPSLPLDVLIPDTEVVDKVREAGDAAATASLRSLEASVWLEAAAADLAERAKADKRK